jgi:hypothetical protein
MTDHVGKNRSEWEKPMESALYLESVAQGLGFFHVEVQENENKGGYLKFLDNCVVLTIEEGEIEVAAIIENLQNLFDKKWHWQLKELEEYRYLVRFPPHRQIANTLIFDTTYFKLRKEGVLVSLKAWAGDIEPLDTLEEAWI